MERREKPSSENNPQVQAPKRDESPVVPQPQPKSGEFVSPPQQEARTEVFSAQSSGQEHQRQTQDGNPVVRRPGGSREGSRQKPLEYTRDGELYVGSLIRKLRWEKGWQLKETAEKMGLTRAKLSQIETNHAVPTDEHLPKIAEVLGTTVEELKEAYQHPRTIHRTPPEQSKRLPTHLQGKPLTEFEEAHYYRPNIRWNARFRQER
jgi:transcriptional regulator with XRE-family HTH domain